MRWMLPPATFAFVALSGVPSVHAEPAAGACTDDLLSPTPLFRSEPIPRNARFFLSTPSLDGASVKLTFGDVDPPEDIPFAVEEADDAVGSVFLVPNAPLEAGRTVQLDAGATAGSYTVGSADDDTAPAALTLTVDETARGDACCTNTTVSVTTTGGLDDDDTPAPVLRLTLRSPAGERVAFLGSATPSVYSVGSIGSACSGTTDALAVEGDAVVVDAVAIDWAGNESPVATSSFTYPAPAGLEDGGEGEGEGEGEDDVPSLGDDVTCSHLGAGASTEGAPFALVGIVGLSALLARRRRT